MEILPGVTQEMLEAGHIPTDPETGEPMSKNKLKKLLNPKKKKEKGPSPAAATVKKDKPKKVKAAEEIYIDDTPAGEKKDVTKCSPATYQPKYVEAAWQSWWEKCGFYTANTTSALKAGEEDKFVMVIPPPNVTGSLHLGHALTVAIEDCLTRWHRMNGKITLWVPGTDHAGIATQSVVEKRLKKEEGIDRKDMGREEFVKQVWQWKEVYGGKITGQIRSLGASVDWKREAFTMDDNLGRAVTEAFCRFYEDGILYRDTRLINWSCALQSAISEIEVDYVDIEKRTFLSVPNHTLKPNYEFGVITSFAYPIDGMPGEEIVIATTRLETMLGDTAVCVHPDDARYKHLHGKFVKSPFVDRKIPIITDATLVDMDFGTGAVKVTPAHDPNDYECGKRHGLEFIIMMTEDGRIAANGGQFAGMMRYDARLAMEEALEKVGLYRGKEPNKMRLGKCSRSGDIIEPMLTPQWYVSCNNMAKRATDAVRNGELKLEPKTHEATWFRWLDNIRDWCISRQLWWGHRIPAYFARITGEEPALDRNEPGNNKRWFIARTREAALSKAAEALGVPPSQIELEQDEDVLDTWFSSGLFPFSVFGWPNASDDLSAFYPTQLLETGLDILFFWVARMVMMGLQLTDKLPFKTVYLHAMVRDKYGRKMSKSLGNVIDPLEVIQGCTLNSLIEKLEQGNLPAKEVEKAISSQSTDFPDGIPECGSDALRFGLLAYTVQGNDINLDIKRVVGYRQFCNKLWNATRFALTYVADLDVNANMHVDIVTSTDLQPRDRFILSRLNATVTEVDKQMNAFVFGAVASALHSFFMYDLCDVYLELIKPVVNNTSAENAGKRRCGQVVLYTCLEQFLRLCHPLMPFVTEELWQRLPGRAALKTSESIMLARYPKPVAAWDCPSAEADMTTVKNAIHAARSMRTEYNVANNVQMDYHFKTSEEATGQALRAVLQRQKQDFCTLAKAASFEWLSSSTDAPLGCGVKVLNDQLSLLVNLQGVLDVGKEVARLTKEKARVQGALKPLVRKMGAADYGEKVPPEVQKQNAVKVQALEAETATLDASIAQFQAMAL